MKKSIAVFLFLLLFLFSSTVHAGDVNITIGPHAVGVLARPGTVVRVPFTITNSSDSQYVKPILLRARETGTAAQLEYDAISTIPLQAAYFEGEEQIGQSILLDKGRARTLIYQLELSDSVKVGDYLLAAGVETQPDHLSSAFSLRSKVRLLAPILLTVSRTGSVDINGTIQSFTTGNKQYFFDSFDSIPLDLTIANIGRNAFRAGGTILVRNGFGQSATYDLNERVIFAGGSRSLSLRQSDTEGVTIHGFFVGTYTVSASVVLTDGTVQLTKSTTFYAFPFKIMFFGLMVMVGGLIVLRKRQ